MNDADIDRALARLAKLEKILDGAKVHTSETFEPAGPDRPWDQPTRKIAFEGLVIEPIELFKAYGHIEVIRELLKAAKT